MPYYPPASGGGYNLVQDEGTSLAVRTTLDFVGAGVTASDVGGETQINIPGGAAAGPSTIPQFVQSGTSPVERWYNGSLFNSLAATNGAYAFNILRAWPLFVSEDITVDRIGAFVNTAVTNSVFRLGIYTTTSRANLYPDALVLDSGELDGATTGLKSTTISQVLTGGTLYWLALLSGTASPNLRRPGLNNSFVIMGVNNTLSGSAGVGWDVTLTYTALPSTFTASGTVLETVGVFCPVYIRRSA